MGPGSRKAINEPKCHDRKLALSKSLTKKLTVNIFHNMVNRPGSAIHIDMLEIQIMHSQDKLLQNRSKLYISP